MNCKSAFSPISNRLVQHRPLAARSLLTAAILSGFFATVSFGQIIGGGFNRVVGGVSIDADGVVQNVAINNSAEWAERVRLQLKGAPADLAQVTKLRHISLRGLMSKLAEAKQNNSVLAEEVAYLGGLTRVEYILLYPETNDIVLAGPAEPWTLGLNGAVVGSKTGQPVLRLDDLILSMAKLNTVRPEQISCSIDPLPEGSLRLQRYLDQISLGPNDDPAAMEPAMRNAFGPQQVLFTGVDGGSHIGRVIFGADYQMKRIGMKLRKSPVHGLPSYLDMLRHSATPKDQSRWWMACNYNAIQRSDDSMVWKISGPGIKLLTEDEITENDGTRKGNGKANPVAAKWANIFTSKIDDLIVADPVFGELRSIMDLSVVAAAIRTHNLENLAQCDLSGLRNTALQNEEADQASSVAPQTVEPQCSFVRAGSSWIVTASGGVLIDPWSTVSEPQAAGKAAAQLSVVRSEGKAIGENWIWN